MKSETAAADERAARVFGRQQQQIAQSQVTVVVISTGYKYFEKDTTTILSL